MMTVMVATSHQGFEGRSRNTLRQRFILVLCLFAAFFTASFNAPRAEAKCEGGSKSFCNFACGLKVLACGAVAAGGCAGLSLATGGFAAYPCGATGAFTCTAYATSCAYNCSTLPCP